MPAAASSEARDETSLQSRPSAGLYQWKYCIMTPFTIPEPLLEAAQGSRSNSFKYNVLRSRAQTLDHDGTFGILLTSLTHRLAINRRSEREGEGWGSPSDARGSARR